MTYKYGCTSNDSNGGVLCQVAKVMLRLLRLKEALLDDLEAALQQDVGYVFYSFYATSKQIRTYYRKIADSCSKSRLLLTILWYGIMKSNIVLSHD